MTATERRLGTPTDAAGLAAFRVLFGVLMALAVVRFVAKGWVNELYLDPAFHFTYLGFDWVRPWPAWGMAAHFLVMGTAALSIALGAFTRVASAVFFLSFTYAELIEKAAYLNHYYLVSLIALLFTVLPVGAAFSFDARRRGTGGRSVPLAAYTLLRAQIGLVYLFAGLAKLNGDWLLEAAPLGLWLGRFTDVPLVGPLLGEPAVALAMSWAGAAFDLAIVPLLCWSRTRSVAYAVAVVFHLAIWLMFPIGIFSFLMLASATIFFDPSWPRRLARLVPALARDPAASAGGAPEPPRRLPRLVLALGAAYVALAVLVPLRLLAYPGASSWTEEGFRFAWRVMLTEKTGQVEFVVVTDAPGGRFRVNPRAELTPLQVSMMATQPDMIHEYAQHLRDRFERQGHGRVRVFADSWAALNGRPSQRLIDPAVDLAAEKRGLGPARYIVPLGS